MNIDLSTIKNSQVRTFYALGWSQHQILVEFYRLLDDTQYDYRMADTPDRKSDTPRESLAHIIYVELVYFEAAKSGQLDFKDLGTEQYKTLSKAQLLAELEHIDQDMFDYLNRAAFDSSRLVEVPWGGKMNVMDVLFFLRDHDILHIGWNLALMDHLNMPRYPSLIQYWGP
jgi:uncharacterized damage-inducible protein DinB